MQALFVDDELIAVEAVIKKFAELGFVVTFCDSGLSALDVVEELKPDIIICDVSMPEMSGFELLKKIRESTSTEGIFFVFLSNRRDCMSVQHSLDLGADAYFIKPNNFKEMVQLAERILAMLPES